jgi:type II secretory pathway pseudopilin PulG
MAKSAKPIPGRPREHGYIMIVMMLFVALMVIAAAATVQTISFQIRREREEELIHRGVQYSRAIRHYYRKFGRYPSSLEELQSANNMRFLRRAYKDPMTGNDFRILHFGDVKISFNHGAGAGLTPVGQQDSGKNPNSDDAGLLGSSPAPKKTDNGAATDNSSGDTSGENASPPPNGPGSEQVFGGGPIVGVVSQSTKKSIREFGGKDHYNQWQFVYDPNMDRGGLLSTPNQPPLLGSTPNGSQGVQQPGIQPNSGTIGVTSIQPQSQQP